MQVHKWNGKLQHACCPGRVALVRLDRVWVAQLVGGLRLACGSSCADWLGLGRLLVARWFLESPFAIAHPQAMVCVLAEHQLCEVICFAVLVGRVYLCEGRVCLYTWGPHLL